MKNTTYTAPTAKSIFNIAFLLLFTVSLTNVQGQSQQSMTKNGVTDIADGLTRGQTNSQQVADCGALVSYTALSEDFEGGIPVTWTAIDNEGNGVIWTTNGAWGEGNYTNGSGNSAMACSDCFGSAEHDAELITSVINLNPGAINVELDYTVNYQNFAAQDFFDVDVTTNGGGSWTNVLSWNEDHGGFFSTPGQDVTLMLDAALAGNSTFQLRFRYYEPTSLDFNWYVSIDDVLVTYCAEPPPPIPTISEWGFIILMMLFLIIGATAMKFSFSRSNIKEG